jgi:hypothetical protein
MGPLYNWLQQFTNHYLTHCHILPTGHSTATLLTSDWTPLYSFVLLQFRPELWLTVPSCNSSARTPQKTPSFIVKNACLLARYLPMNVLLLRAYASGMCLPSRCLAMRHSIISKFRSSLEFLRTKLLERQKFIVCIIILFKNKITNSCLKLLAFIMSRLLYAGFIGHKNVNVSCPFLLLKHHSMKTCGKRTPISIT